MVNEVSLYFLFHTRLVQSVRFTEGRHVPLPKKNKFALFFCNVCVAQIRMWVKNRLILPVTVKERASRLRQTDIFPMNTGV